MFTVTDFLKILERSHQQSGLTRLNFLRSDLKHSSWEWVCRFVTIT